MFREIINHVRSRRNLIHCITNYVTANDCANLLFACGASPVMADDPEESVQITSNAQGLLLNLGTPNPRKLESMLLSGRCANERSIPIVFDPVGVSASDMRLKAAQQMLREIRFSVIRGNADEIGTLLCGEVSGRGVDSALHDDAFDRYEHMACRLAREKNCIVSMSAKVDIVTDGKTVYRVYNGHEMMRLITGAGCQLSALTAAYAAATPENLLESALTAACMMGVCGEKAYARLKEHEGNASMRNYLIDAVCRMTAEELEGRARYGKR